MTPVLLATALPTWADIASVAPALTLVVGGALLILLEVATKSQRRTHMPWLTAGFAVVAALLAWNGRGPAHAVFGGSAMADDFSVFFALLVCAALALAALAAAGYLRERDIERGEYYGLLLFSASGMLLLTMAADLLTMFVALEVMSIATYALVAFRRDQDRSAEAAFKYLVLGALSSALFLYGAALLFAATGHIKLVELTRYAATGHPATLFYAGAGLAAVGFAFKVAAVPFHMWTPDVYEGAPTPVTAFMAAGVKAAAFAALLRLLLIGFGPQIVATAGVGWGQILYVLALLTVVVGNLLAIVQDNVKRLLAYSSVAHAGYALLAVTAAAWGGPLVTASVLFYLLVYSVTAVGAFAVVAAVEKKQPENGVNTGHIDELAGLGRRHPGLAFAMTVFMFSLAGVPPTGGFMAKLEVFRSLFAAARTSPAMATPLYWLAVIGVLAAVAGVYYYLRVVVWMYMKPEPESPVVARGVEVRVGVALAALAVLLLGILPGTASSWAQDAVKSAFVRPGAVAHYVAPGAVQPTGE